MVALENRFSGKYWQNTLQVATSIKNEWLCYELDPSETLGRPIYQKFSYLRPFEIIK